MSSIEKQTVHQKIDEALAHHIAENRPFRIHNSLIRFSSIVVGMGCIFLGYLLFIKGVTGQASIVVDAKSVSGQLVNAAPGLFFAVSGVIIVTVSLIFREKPARILIERRSGTREERISVQAAARSSGAEGEEGIEVEILDIPTFLRKHSD